MQSGTTIGHYLTIPSRGRKRTAVKVSQPQNPFYPEILRSKNFWCASLRAGGGAGRQADAHEAAPTSLSSSVYLLCAHFSRGVPVMAAQGPPRDSSLPPSLAADDDCFREELSERGALPSPSSPLLCSPGLASSPPPSAVSLMDGRDVDDDSFGAHALTSSPGDDMTGPADDDP